MIARLRLRFWLLVMDVFKVLERAATRVYLYAATAATDADYERHDDDNKKERTGTGRIVERVSRDKMVFDDDLQEDP